METTIISDTGLPRRKKDITPLSLLISTIREQGGGVEKESVHKMKFMRLLNEEGYEDYRDAVVEEWLRIKYSTALNAAQPPTLDELNRRRRAKREKAITTRAAIEAVKAKIKGKLLQILMPNGKRLGSCTGAECVQFGGWFTCIGEHVGARRVKDVLNETQIINLVASQGDF